MSEHKNKTRWSNNKTNKYLAHTKLHMNTERANWNAHTTKLDGVLYEIVALANKAFCKMCQVENNVHHAINRATDTAQNWWRKMNEWYRMLLCCCRCRRRCCCYFCSFSTHSPSPHPFWFALGRTCVEFHHRIIIIIINRNHRHR